MLQCNVDVYALHCTKCALTYFDKMTHQGSRPDCAYVRFQCKWVCIFSRTASSIRTTWCLKHVLILRISGMWGRFKFHVNQGYCKCASSSKSLHSTCWHYWGKRERLNNLFMIIWKLYLGLTCLDWRSYLICIDGMKHESCR